MIKIPATPAGLPAVESCIAEGINVNVTLIFSRQRYSEVMDAFLAGLKNRSDRKLGIDRVASVASFFVSRVDTLIDQLLDEKIKAGGSPALGELKGKAAIANAKLAYADFKKKFQGKRFTDLASGHPQVQRPLWASTSTKNPAFPDVYYVEALIGAQSVNTMPPATIVAYKDHGRPALRVEDNLEAENGWLKRLEEAGIFMDDITKKLETDGVASFEKSFVSLIAAVEEQRKAAGGK
jgi:transaldolase